MNFGAQWEQKEYQSVYLLQRRVNYYDLLIECSMQEQFSPTVWVFRNLQKEQMISTETGIGKLRILPKADRQATTGQHC